MQMEAVGPEPPQQIPDSQNHGFSTFLVPCLLQGFCLLWLMNLKLDPDLLSDLGSLCPFFSESQFPHGHMEGTMDFCVWGPLDSR